MSRTKKSDFQKICNFLDQNYVVNTNEITYVRNYLKTTFRIDEDRDMLLKIKSEAEEEDTIAGVALIVSFVSLLFSGVETAMDLLSNILKWPPSEINSYALGIAGFLYPLILISSMIFIWKRLGRYKPGGRWRKYVLMVLNETPEKA